MNSGTKSRKSLAGIVILILLLAVMFPGCGEDSAGGGGMMDPYEAYGIERGDGGLGFAILDDPPKAIAIQPVMIQKPYYEDIMLSVEPLVFEKGTSLSFSFDEEFVHEDGNAYPLNGSVEMKYLRDDDDGLFEINTDAYGYATFVRNGIYSNEDGQHKVDGRSYSFSGFGGDPEEYFSFSIGVDKGDADQADGHMGVVYCKITGVKR